MIAGISETERQVVRDMMSDLIMGTDGIDILRKRVDTSHKPASFDEDFGEIIDQGEVWYLDLNLRAKFFGAYLRKRCIPCLEALQLRSVRYTFRMARI